MAALQQARRAAAQAEVKANFDRRSFRERQLALSLVQMARHDTEAVEGLSSDAVEGLITTLIVSSRGISIS